MFTYRMITSNSNLRSYHDNKWNNKSRNRLTSHYKLERNSIEDLLECLPKEQPVAPVGKTETSIRKINYPCHRSCHRRAVRSHRLSRIPLFRGKCFFPNGKDVSSRGRLTFYAKWGERSADTIDGAWNARKQRRNGKRETERDVWRGWGTEA